MVKKYTKGDKSKVVSRIGQVSRITLYVPSDEKCMCYLYDGLISLCNNYINESDGDSFLMMPNIDFYNVVLFVNKCCKEKNVDTNYINAMMSIVRTFVNLRYVNVVFKDDVEMKDSYERLVNMDSKNTDIQYIITELANVYSIDAIDMYLGDMFDQEIVDCINKHLISNGIISNSYLERDFLIEFEFGEYTSYINMFVDNNINMLSMYDSDIIDYLRTFPYIVKDISKPDINVYTNYKDV